MNTNETIAELEARLAALKDEEAAKRKAKELAEREEQLKKQQEEARKKEEAKLEGKRAVLNSVAEWIEGNTKLKCTVNVGMAEHSIDPYSNMDVTDGEFKRNYGFSFQRQRTGNSWSGNRSGKEYIRLEAANFLHKKNFGFDIRAMANLLISKFGTAKLQNEANIRSVKACGEKEKAVKALREQHQTVGGSEWYWDDLGTGVKFSHSPVGAECSITLTCRGDAAALVAFYNSFVKDGRVTPRSKSNG